MESKLETLPPLKRLRLLRKQEEEELHDNKENIPPPPPNSWQLPAKKRIQSRDLLLLQPPPPPPSVAADTYCLPAKKRVWALQPHLLLPEFGDDETSKPYQKEQLEDDIKQPPKPLQKEEVGDDNGNVVHDDEADDGIVCAVCQSTDGDPTDPIVFCDGCDLMVHTTCYGNPLINGIPEGDWFCNQCLFTQSDKQNTSISCYLCPSKVGAMKATKDGSWAHVVCALLVPEVFFEDPVGREGIDWSMVPKKRWDRKCYVCKRRKGCVIECSEPNCHLAFHVTCGVKEDLCIEYQQGKKRKDTIVAGFCKTHTELWKKQQRTGKFKIVAREENK